MRTVPFPHPGEVLKEEFLDPMGITAYRLATDIGVTQTRISQIIHGQRALTTDTALRLARYFGTTETFWMAMQSHYEAAIAKDEIATDLAKIRPFNPTAA